MQVKPKDARVVFTLLFHDGTVGLSAKSPPFSCLIVVDETFEYCRFEGKRVEDPVVGVLPVILRMHYFYNEKKFIKSDVFCAFLVVYDILI